MNAEPLRVLPMASFVRSASANVSIRGGIDADFDEFDSPPTRRPTSSLGQKRPRDRGPPAEGGASPRAPPEDSREYQSWVHKYEPLTVSELAVQPKKVDEVRFWFQAHAAGASLRSPILLLQGPPGCGKTATLRVLASEIGLNVQEFLSSGETVLYDRDPDVGKPFIPNDEVSYTGQWQMLEQFFLRANRYMPLIGLDEGARRKIVLVEDIPPLVHKHPDRFRQIIRQYRQSSRGFPMVIVASSQSQSDGLNKLIPSEFRSEVGMDVITFNPVTTGNISRVFKTILVREARTGRSEFAHPGVEACQCIAEASHGDIRGAINALQIAALRGCGRLCQNGAPTPRSARKTKGAKKKGAQVNSIAVADGSIPSIGSRDSNLDLFHAIGKVLYAKREDRLESFPCPQTRSHLARQLLKSKPEDIVDLAPISKDGFVAFLHENYPSFFPNVEHLAQAADHLSASDGFFREWNGTGKICLSEYGSLVSVRGLMFFNDTVAKARGAMKTFHKSRFYHARAETEEMSQGLRGAFASHGLNNQELFTTVAPIFLQCYPEALPTHCRGMRHFEGKLAPPLPKTETPKPTLDLLVHQAEPAPGTTEDYHIEDDEDDDLIFSSH